MGYNGKNNFHNNRNNNWGNNNRGNNNRGNNNRGNNNRNNNRGNITNPPYVGAPYNFVSFSNNVYSYPKNNITKHCDMKDELITGEINYEIENMTSLFVGSGRKDNDGVEMSCVNSKDQYIIPGSTMRGLIRNNVQILGLCSVVDDVDDYALMYREVAKKNKLNERYEKVLGKDSINVGINNEKKVSILKNVKAGYVTEENGIYKIYTTSVNKGCQSPTKVNYYIVSERDIIENLNQYPFFKNNSEYLMYKTNCEFVKTEYKNRTHYAPLDKKNMVNKDYKPFYKKVSYEVGNNGRVTCIDEPGERKYNGTLLSSGYMNEKKAIYIIPEKDDKEEPIVIPQSDVKAFQIDLKKRENTFKRNKEFFDLPGANMEKRENTFKIIKEFFDLPGANMEKPVFYIYLEGRLYFGFTPRLRLFYDHTIKEGIPKNHISGLLDYSSVMFGHANSSDSYKSKLSFSDAVIVEKKCNTKVDELILLEPKPTSYMDYLTSNNGKAQTYNSKDFKLRGIKQYWLRKEEISGNIAPNQKSVVTKFKAIEKNNIFKGKIRFQNLTKDEFGLLLWSIKLKPESMMNVGRGKAFGRGNIKLNVKNVKLFELQKAYDIKLTQLNLSPYRNIDEDEQKTFINYYKENINKELGGKKIDDLLHIKEFFAMKDSSCMPDKEKIRFMQLDNYQNRRKCLDFVLDVTKNN